MECRINNTNLIVDIMKFIAAAHDASRLNSREAVGFTESPSLDLCPRCGDNMTERKGSIHSIECVDEACGYVRVVK